MSIQIGSGDDYDFKGFAPGELDSMFSSVFKNPLSSFSVSFKLDTIPVVNNQDAMDIENTSPVVEKSVETTFFSTQTPAFTYNPAAYGVYRHKKVSNPISRAVVSVLKKICRDDK